VQRKWYVVDADGVVLGRLASQVAAVLRGKNKPIFTPHVDTGDYVIIVNAEKAILTGKKLDQKVYYHHSGFPGGLSETSYRDLMEDKPASPLKRRSSACCPRAPLAVRWPRSCAFTPARARVCVPQAETLEIGK
jgi:large subunit ribosomal protein L13